MQIIRKVWKANLEAEVVQLGLYKLNVWNITTTNNKDKIPRKMNKKVKT